MQVSKICPARIRNAGKLMSQSSCLGMLIEFPFVNITKMIYVGNDNHNLVNGCIMIPLKVLWYSIPVTNYINDLLQFTWHLPNLIRNCYKSMFMKYIPLWLYLPIINSIPRDSFNPEGFGYSDFHIYWIWGFERFQKNIYDNSCIKWGSLAQQYLQFWHINFGLNLSTWQNSILGSERKKSILENEMFMT